MSKETNQEFVAFCNELKVAIQHGDTFPAADITDSELVLSKVKEIAHIVLLEIRREFPNKIMNEEERDAVLAVEKALLATRGLELVRIESFKNFEDMTQGVSVN
jgi:hypothetical protein